MNLHAAMEKAGLDTERDHAYTLLVAFARNQSPDISLPAFLKRNGVAYETLAVIALEFVRGDIKGRFQAGAPRVRGEERLGGQTNGAVVTNGGLTDPAAEPTHSDGVDQHPGADAGQCLPVPPSLPERSGDQLARAAECGHAVTVSGSPQGEESGQWINGHSAQRYTPAPSPTERSGDQLRHASKNAGQPHDVAGSPQGEESSQFNPDQNVQGSGAAPSPTERSGDQTRHDDTVHRSFVSGSPQGRADHLPYASSSGEASDALLARPPAREPSAGFIRATIDANRAAARSVLNTIKIEDGRYWADVCPYEVGTWMKRDYIRGTALLTVCGPLNDRQSRMTFGELLSPERAKIALDQAQKDLAHVG